MFGSRAYKAALCVGAGTCALFAYKDNLKKLNLQQWFKAPLNAAVQDPPYTNLVKSYQPQWEENWDKRHVEKVEGGSESKPTATRHIVLIRHGQYELDGVDDVDRVLTALGREQAKLTGERLQEMKLDVNDIYESTMTRALETSAIIRKFFPNAEVHTSDILREGAPIAPVPGHPTWQPPPKQFFADGPRIEAAFRKYIHRASSKQEKDSVEVFICHANVIRYIVCRALQFPPEGWLRFGLRHASITWLTIRPNGRVSLRCLGDAGHMPPEKLTYN